MKVLSLKEPYATLIKEKKKLIETRSWKTEYRGELYIHASSTKIKENKLNKELISLLEDKKLNYGNIICKCKLVDCIYMTKDYVEKIKKNNQQEYICGVYEEGRYAWILEDITPLKKSIKVKGQLNIWNYYNEFEIMGLMDEIEYGWVDKNGGKHELEDESFSDNYCLQSPKKMIENKLGVCWDQVELERYYFKGHDLNVKTYFIVYYDNLTCPTHTFLTFEKTGKYYWFEHAWKKFRGIYEYNTLKELLFDIRDRFIKYELNDNYQMHNIMLYEYNKPNYSISVEEFFNHCESSNYIDFDSL